MVGQCQKVSGTTVRVTVLTGMQPPGVRLVYIGLIPHIYVINTLITMNQTNLTLANINLMMLAEKELKIKNSVHSPFFYTTI